MSEEKLTKENENRVNLTVITTEGNYSGEFNIHNHFHQVIDRTIKELELSIDTAQYELFVVGNPNALNPAITIEQAGLVDGSKLEFRIRNGGGGQGV